MPAPTQLAIIDGDQVIFKPKFGMAVVTPVPGTIKALGGGKKMSVSSKPVCVQGDEKTVKIKTAYTAPPYSILGEGLAEITALASDQIAKKTKVNSKAVIMKGSFFDMQFTVTTRAKNEVGDEDKTPVHMGGKGEFFIPSNTKFFAK